MEESENNSFILKVGRWLYQEHRPGLALHLILLALSLENHKTKKWVFQRLTIKNLLGIRNDGVLTDAFKYWEEQGVLKQIASHKSSKRRVTYTYTIHCPAGAQYFFFPRDFISVVGRGRRKQKGPALELTNNGLRFLLFLHDQFSMQQSQDESLKEGQNGHGSVIFDSGKAKDKLKFRNFHRYVEGLEKLHLLDRNGYSENRTPKYLLVNPYFKKRMKVLPNDPPQVVIEEVSIRQLVKSAEAMNLISQHDRPTIEELSMEYGLTWVEDALFSVYSMGLSRVSNPIETVRKILINWMENGKLIGFHDDFCRDDDYYETEELANLFMGRRPRMLRNDGFIEHVVCFFDKGFAKPGQKGFPLLIEDFPGGRMYYRAQEELKQRFLVPRYYDHEFNSLCQIYGLKWVADAYITVRGDWPDANTSITEKQRLEIVKNRLNEWKSNSKCLIYAADHEGFIDFVSNPKRLIASEINDDYRRKYIDKYGVKIYFILEPFVGSQS